MRKLDQERALKDVGRRIAELRRERGWTQEVFAARLGVQPNNLQRIELGRQNVTVYTLVRLANALGVPLASLFEAPADRLGQDGSASVEARLSHLRGVRASENLPAGRFACSPRTKRGASDDMGAIELAKCPSCGAAIDVVAGRNLAKCPYCGASLFVNAGSPGAGPTTENLMRLARAALDADNPDEAYSYFTRVLESEPANVEGWLGKAEAAGLAATLQNSRRSEVLGGVKEAVSSAKPDVQEETRRRGARIIASWGSVFFAASERQMEKFAGLDDAWPDHVGYACDVLDVLAEAHEISPSSAEPLRAGVDVCRALLAGHKYFDRYAEPEDSFALGVLEGVSGETAPSGGWRMHRLTPTTEARMRAILADQTTALREVDPTFVPPPEPVEVRRVAKPPPYVPISVAAILCVILLVWCAAR